MEITAKYVVIYFGFIGGKMNPSDKEQPLPVFT